MFQLVKREILDKQLSEDPISWAMLWSYDGSTSENTVVILPRKMFQKELLSGSEKGRIWMSSGGGKSGGGGWVERQRRWDMEGIQTNPGCLFVTSPSPTSPFCAPIPLYFCKQHCSGRKISGARTYAFVSISDPDCRYSENISWITVFHHVFFLTPLTSYFSIVLWG